MAAAPREDNWRARTADSGSALRSPANGKPSRGNGSGRGGGRSGRGGGPPRSRTTSTRKVPASDATETSKPSGSVPPTPNNTSSTAHPTPAAEKPTRPKGPSRQNTRNNGVPSVVVDPSTPTSPAPTSAAAGGNSGNNPPSRPSNRRKRSQQGQPRPPASATIPAKGAFPPPSPSPLKDSSSSTRSSKNFRNNLPNPPHTAPLSRETSTHSSGLRSNIDAAIQQMRASALGDHRPSTPGSHIDWAGDDEDESLPDLNDWGVSTNSDMQPQEPLSAASISIGATELTPDNSQLISPLIVEGLKPLPAFAPTGTPPVKGPLPSLHIPPTELSTTVIDRSPHSREASPVRRSKSPANDTSVRRTKDTKPRSRGPSPQPSPVREHKPLPLAGPATLPPKPSFLPAKPIAAAETAEMPARSSKAGASPMRSPVSPVRARSKSPMAERRQPPGSPIKPFPEGPQLSSVTSGDAGSSSPETSSTSTKVNEGASFSEEGSKPKEVDNHLAPPDNNVSSGLSASIHAPSKEPSPTEPPLRSAPGNLQSSSSSPALLNSQAHTRFPRNPHGFHHNQVNPNNLTHTRAHTVGRPHPQSHHNHHPHNNNGPLLHQPRGNPRLARSGFTTPSKGEPQHARTQSSPPATGAPHHHGSARHPLNARPVITGDAISRLARTIGGMGVGSPPRTKA